MTSDQKMAIFSKESEKILTSQKNLSGIGQKLVIFWSLARFLPRTSTLEKLIFVLVVNSDILV
jgi:hypothetical protein